LSRLFSVFSEVFEYSPAFSPVIPLALLYYIILCENVKAFFHFSEVFFRLIASFSSRVPILYQVFDFCQEYFQVFLRFFFVADGRVQYRVIRCRYPYYIRFFYFVKRFFKFFLIFFSCGRDKRGCDSMSRPPMWKSCRGMA